MAETLYLTPNATKPERYEEILPQIKALISGESDKIAVYANVAAALKEAMGFFWVGFYRVGEGQLVLGPFQGPIACTRIAFGKGVCGTCYTEAKTLIVPDVDAFPGHIACSSASKSEIVVPVFDKDGKIIAILDVDSDKPDDFDESDQKYLEELCAFIGEA